MKYKKLPTQVAKLLDSVEAPPRLVAHLILVHDVASTLVDELREHWPNLPLDKHAILMGAAIHDIGKVLHTEELSRPGSRHEEAGTQLLIDKGFPADYARFARTHGSWDVEPTPSLEDLIVALADKIWRGVREQELEAKLADCILVSSGEQRWETYTKLDDIITGITKDSDLRLAWQAAHSL